MWMQHYSKESHHSKLRPLMPRLATAMQTPCRACIHQKISANNRHQSNRGINAEPLVTSSRWNPTAEQVEALREMYRRGITTPSARQIQQIVAKLRRFGKIEGKNVFYWFQNHKARERQKKRRQQEASMHRAGVAKLHQKVENTEIYSDQENCLNISTSQPLPKENSTLELFPFPVGGNQDTRVIPNKFFEFLPLKN